jgi:integrase
MRYREAFSLYRRKIQVGKGKVEKTIFYFQTYDEKGRRTVGRTTGQTTRTAAREYCNRLLREGKLLEARRARVPTFEEFAGPWWDFDTCEYLKSQRARRPISENYAAMGKHVTVRHLIPKFGKRYLDDITEDEINKWMLSLQTTITGRRVRNEEGELVGKCYDNGTINWIFGYLRLMLGEAVRRRIIKSNPCDLIKDFKAETNKVEILTPDEVKAFFSKDWFDDAGERVCFTANKLSACSGMRIGEVLGLRGEYLYDTYIKVCAQYNKNKYKDTKTHKDRDIPVPAVMKRDLEKLKQVNGDGFLFSMDGGVTPVKQTDVRDITYKVFSYIGITEKDRIRRGLTFHGWRHFFNTTLIMANVSDRKVQAVTGHADAKMTTHYQHLKNEELGEVKDVQDRLFDGGKKAVRQNPVRLAARKRMAARKGKMN